MKESTSFEDHVRAILSIHTMQQQRIEELRAERDAMAEALRRIANGRLYGVNQAMEIARAALAQKGTVSE